MSLSLLDSGLYGPLFTTDAMRELFSDERHVRRMIEVEVALARAEARLGIIPQAAADEIEASASSLKPDFAKLTRGLQNDGVPTIALLAEWREHLSEDGKTYLHWGATTQDIVDSALVLGLREALGLLEGQLDAVMAGLATLADAHRGTLMPGRTHSQQALPITFGWKVAGWLAPLIRHQGRLAELRPRLLVLQFGGAAGTLAALGQDGLKVQEALAEELGLSPSGFPWHTQRDNLAELAGWLPLVTGSLAKMTQDIILMAQSEVSELNESADGSRGGSSTMPQKSNPIQSELVIAAHRMNAALLGSMHQALIAEHERATHGWQLEWLSLPQMLGLTSGALETSGRLARELKVDVERMAQNVADSRGLMLAEAYSFALTPHVGRSGAKKLVQAAVKKALTAGVTLSEALFSLPDLPGGVPRLTEGEYLGRTNEMIDAVLADLKSPG